MKKVILGILALIFAIAVVTGGYILITSRNLQVYVEEDGVCPYSWQEQRDGSYLLTINATAYPEHDWTVDCYPKNYVAVTALNSDPEARRFSIVALNEGETYVQIVCQQTEPFEVCAFEVDLRINVSGKGTITILETAHKSYDGVAVLGEDTAYPVQWWMDPNGAISLLIEDETAAVWEAVDYEPESIAVSGPFYRDGSCGFEIQGNLAGTFPLTLQNGEGAVIRLEIEVAEDLSAAISWFDAETRQIDRSEEHAALESIVGAVALPEQATVTEYRVGEEKGTVSFMLNDSAWNWRIEPGGTVEDLVGGIAEWATESAAANAGGLSLQGYAFDDGVAVAWNDGVRAMILRGEETVTLTDALALAEQLVVANNG